MDYLDQTDGRESTALMWAAWRGHLAACQALLEGGAKVNLVDNCGSSALHWVVCKKFDDVAQLLKNHGGLHLSPGKKAVTAAAPTPAKVHCTMHTAPRADNNCSQLPIPHGQALIDACKVGNVSEIQQLLALGAPVNYKDQKDGRESTPLM